MEVNKAQAYRMYGRADADKWIKKGLCESSRISPGKTRYKLFELQKLASVKQNCLLYPKSVIRNFFVQKVRL